MIEKEKKRRIKCSLAPFGFIKKRKKEKNRKMKKRGEKKRKKREE